MKKLLLAKTLSELFLFNLSLTAQILSVQSGDWNNASTWACTCVPTAAQDVKILSGHTVNLTTNQTINNVELEGNLNLNTNTRTLTVNGNFVVTGASSLISGGATSRVINVNGNFLVNPGASVNMGAFNLTVTGTTTNHGTLVIGSNTGVKTLNGAITNTGAWTSTAVTTATNLLVRNGITNNGSFNASAIRFTNNNQSITGSNPLNFTGTVSINGSITVTNHTTLNLAGQLNGTAAGSTFAAGTGAVVFYSFNTRPMTTGAIACGSNPNTFRYNRVGNQDVSTGDYYNLIIEGTGDKTLNGAGVVNVSNNFTVESTANLFCGGENTVTGGTFTLKSTFDHTEGVSTQHQMANFVLDGGYLNLGNSILDGWVVNNNFTVTTNGGTVHTAGDPTNGFTVNGNTIIQGNFIFDHDNSNARAYFNGLVTVAPTGSWNSTALANNPIIRFRSNILNNGTFNAGGCTFDVSNQQVSGNTLNFASVNVEGVIVDNMTTVYLTLNGICLTGTGTWRQNPNTFLYLRGDANVSSLSANAVPNTVTYYQNRTNHDVNPGTYYNLVIDKTTGTDADIAGTSGGTVTVVNSLVIQNGRFELNTATDILNVNGTTSILSSTSDLYFSDASAVANLGTLVMGNGGTINGNANGNAFANTFTTNGTGANIGQCNFTVNGMTNLNANLNFTSNAGSKTFIGLVTINPGVSWVSTTITATGGLNFRGGITNNGTSFTAGRATFEVNNQSLSGSTQYTFNQTLRLLDNIQLLNQASVYLASTGLSMDGMGTWVQDVNSFLYIQGDATASSINSLAAPNTVTYYGGVTQDVNPGTYHHLVINKSSNTYANVAGNSSGTVQVNGNLTVNGGWFNLNNNGDVVNVLGNTTIVGNGINSQVRFEDAGGVANLNHLTLTVGGRIHGTVNGQANATTLTVTPTGGRVSQCNLTVSGTTSINGTLDLDNNNGIKRFVGLVTLNAGGVWNSTTITTAGNLNFRGDITNNGTSFTAGAATFDTNNQNLSGTTQLVFNNTVTITSIQVNNFTTVDLASTGTSLTGNATGQWAQQPGSYLKIAGDVNTVVMATSAMNNTVEYYNNVQQNVGTGTYHHLLINKSGNRADIAGAGSGTVNVNGDLTIQQGELRFNNTGDIVNVAGNTLITGNTSRLEMTSGVPTANLNHLTMSNNAAMGTGTTTTTGNVNANTFTVSGAGTMSVGRANFTVANTTTVNGNLSINNNTGVKTFSGLVTVNSGGSWNSTSVVTTANLVFQNGIHNDGSFIAAVATFNTNNQSLTGSNALEFNSIISVNAINVTNHTTVNHTSTAANALTGTGTWTQGANSVLNTTVSSMNINAMNASANGNTVNYNRNNTQTIYHPINGEYFNLTLSNTSSKTASAGTKIVLGNLTIAGTASLNVATNNVDIEIFGNWLNTSTVADPFAEGTRTVTFKGTNPQIISNTGSQPGTDFYNLVINNSSSTGVLVTGNANIHTRIVSGGTLTLTNGYVNTNSSNMIVVLNGGNSTGGSVNSFVNGPIRKIGNQAFVFPTGQDVLPVGKGTEDVWARIGISAPANNTTQFTAQYFFTSYGDMTKDATLTHVSFHEYWILDRAVTTNAVQVTLYYEDASRSYITDYTSADLVVARYTSGNFWTSEGQSARSNTNPGWVTSNVVSNFSPFTFGSISGGNPFPVELLNFTATALNNHVKVSWRTASEINTNYFQVEKSIDGINFEKVFTEKAAGNSHQPKDYQGFDFEPYHGISYYRLKTVDHDGKFMYSNVVAVNFQANSTVSVYPNPVKDQLHIQLSKETLILDVAVYDLNGKLVWKENLAKTSEVNLNVKDWTAGVYVVKITTDDTQFTKKIIKE